MTCLDLQSGGEEGGKKRKRKTKKKGDSDKPKRAQSSYMLWLADARESIKEENPGISITEILKVAGEKWRGLGPEDKAVSGHLLPYHGDFIVLMA